MANLYGKSALRSPTVQHAVSGSGVPFTVASRDGLRKLSTRFEELGRPMPAYALIEIAVLQMVSNYCLTGGKVGETSLQKLIKRHAEEMFEERKTIRASVAS